LIRRELLGAAQVPGGAELRLFSHGRDFMIVLDRNELMSTRMRGSEESLAIMTIDQLPGRTDLHLLIGGYGMGFTLRAALAKLGPKARVTVAELVPEIIEWARGPMAKLTGDCLVDSRVVLRMGDVADAIAEATNEFDAILLDVDNGPDGLVRDANDRIYSRSGLQAAKRALKTGGVLAVWSAAADQAFTARLIGAGFAVHEVRVSARGNGKGPKHVIWFAQTS
jgi:spermidine synthase